jgi:hypothetical protein
LYRALCVKNIFRYYTEIAMKISKVALSKANWCGAASARIGLNVLLGQTMTARDIRVAV